MRTYAHALGAFSIPTYTPRPLHTAVTPNIQTEFLSVYQQQLKDMIIGQVDKEGPARDRPLEGLKIVVNAGNGMGGFLADTLTEVLLLYGSILFRASSFG